MGLGLVVFSGDGDDVAGADVLAELEAGLVAEPLQLRLPARIRLAPLAVVGAPAAGQAVRRDADHSHAEILEEAVGCRATSEGGLLGSGA